MALSVAWDQRIAREAKEVEQQQARAEEGPCVWFMRRTDISDFPLSYQLFAGFPIQLRTGRHK